MTNLETLTAAETAYAVLKAEADQAAVDQTAANSVIEKINGIGTVAYTDEVKEKIDEARNAYNALTDAQRRL